MQASTDRADLGNLNKSAISETEVNHYDPAREGRSRMQNLLTKAFEVSLRLIYCRLRQRNASHRTHFKGTGDTNFQPW